MRKTQKPKKRKNSGRCSMARGKARYSSDHEAEAVIKNLRRKGREEYLRAYSCQACGGFHITSRSMER